MALAISLKVVNGYKINR